MIFRQKCMILRQNCLNLRQKCKICNKKNHNFVIKLKSSKNRFLSLIIDNLMTLLNCVSDLCLYDSSDALQTLDDSDDHLMVFVVMITYLPRIDGLVVFIELQDETQQPLLHIFNVLLVFVFHFELSKNQTKTNWLLIKFLMKTKV